MIQPDSAITPVAVRIKIHSLTSDYCEVSRSEVMIIATPFIPIYRITRAAYSHSYLCVLNICCDEAWVDLNFCLLFYCTGKF